MELETPPSAIYRLGLGPLSGAMAGPRVKAGHAAAPLPVSILCALGSLLLAAPLGDI